MENFSKTLSFYDKNLKRCTFDISNWYGRFGNNVIQVASCLFLSKLFEGCSINRNFHPQLLTFHASQSQNKQVNSSSVIKEKFFPGENGDHLIENHKLTEDSIEIWYKDFSSYVRLVQENLLKFNVFVDEPISEDTLVVHLRGEDVFTSRQLLYTQCPLSHILNVSKIYKKTIVVYQDDSNPIVGKLKENSNFIFQSSTIENDYSLLCRASHFLIGGCSTFAETAAMSRHKKVVYTSDANRFNDHIKSKIVHLNLDDNYCGGKSNWNADINQMLTYKVKEKDYMKKEKST